MQLIHKEITVPEDSNLYFVGDIHGCYDLLMQALREVGFNKDKDYLVCVGDLIDRGPDNYKVLAKFLYGNIRCISVMGNHDAFMGYSGLDYTFANWLHNGGRWVLDDGLDNDQLEAMSQDIRERLPVFLTVHHRDKTYGVVHGGVPNIYNGNGVQEEGFVGLTRNWFRMIQDVENYVEGNPDMSLKQLEYLVSPYLWDRNVIEGIQDSVKYPRVAGVDYTIHGHTYVAYPTLDTNRLYIDTGGVFNGQLTIACVDNCGINTMTTNNNEEPVWRTI